MPALGGPPRKVAGFSGPAERVHPAWSSDGGELACAVSDDVLRITHVDSGEFRDLALPDIPGRVYDVSWSPDGRFFALVDAPSYNAPVTRLWILRASDGNAIPLSAGSTNVWGPSFDSRQNLYYVGNSGGAMDLWRQALGDDGTPAGPPEALTVALGLFGRAAISPDGKKLAYAKGRVVANVWRVPIRNDRPATWEDATPLTSEQAFVDTVDVCRNGQMIVFSSDRASSLDLWVMPSGGGEMKQLTSLPTSDWAPAWSPDCRTIAFHSDRSGNRDVWVVPVETGPARQLTSRPENDMDPRWSPDGGTIVFSSELAWAIPAEGGEPRELIELGNRPDDWSPDGEWVLYRSAADGRRWRWSVEGGRNEPLDFESSASRFSLDGRHIYYLSPTEDGIWELSLADRGKRRLTDLSGRPGKIGPYALATDGRYLYFVWRLDESDIWVMDVE
jgi:Tol biopolymer transport system component